MLENETLSYDYDINNNVQFKDSITIEPLNKDTAFFINDCDLETLQKLITAIVKKADNLNGQITRNLGVKETENPILYSNPITSLNAILYNLASDTILDVKINQERTNGE